MNSKVLETTLENWVGLFFFGFAIGVLARKIVDIRIEIGKAKEECWVNSLSDCLCKSFCIQSSFSVKL